MRAVVIAIVIAGLAAGARRAAADSEVGVIVTGEASLQPQLAAEIESWFHGHALTVVPAAIDPEAINAMIDCFVIEDLACARKIVDDHAKVASVVFVRIDSSPGPNNTRDIVLTAYWFDKGQPSVFDERRTCEKCSDEKSRAAADDLAAALARAGRHEIGRYKLTSSPTGARVAIDGKAIGMTPLEGDLTPGDHEIEATLGARTMKRMMSIRRGDVTALDLPLPADTAPPLAGRSHLVPALVLAGGAAAVITGGVLIGVNQDPDPKRNPQPPTLRDTKTGGIVLGVTGLAAIAGGVYLWLHVSADSAPVVALERGGAQLGWTRHF